VTSRSNPPPASRRTPRQARSRATRDAIVEAAARVLAEVGLEKATTARIAEVAGVGPGSLYQYFPSKDTLVAAVYEREAEEQHRAFLALVTELGTDDVPRLVRAFVAWTVQTLEDNAALYRVLLDEVPRVSGLHPSRLFDRKVAASLASLLALWRDRIAVRDVDAAALLVVRAFRYAVIPLVEEPLVGEARERFIEELTDLIAGYLLLPRPWRDGTAAG
jgi:AcrR family transcriptional regulator